MYPMRLTRNRRSAIGDLWPFPIPGAAPPNDPLNCLARWPSYTWNPSTGQCVSAAPQGSVGGGVMDYMRIACQQLPTCRWDLVTNVCQCNSSSGLVPDAVGTGGGTVAQQTQGTTSTCPAGTMAIPFMGQNVCMPTTGPGIPAVPSWPNGVPPQQGQQPGQQTQPVEEPSWWSKQTTGTKAAIVGGAALVGVGLLLAMFKASGSNAPTVVYSGGSRL